MSNTLRSEQNLLEKYNQDKELLCRYGATVDDRLIYILKEGGFDLKKIQIPPKYRLKSNDSLLEKIMYRKVINRSDPYCHVTDKIGTRIVVTTQQDVEQVHAIVNNDTTYWKAKTSRQLEKYLKNPKEFDYNALHLNLTPSNSCPDFDGMNKKKRESFTCELQIRSLLQHTLAEVAHDIIYKGLHAEDGKIVRGLSQGNALLEVAEEIYMRIISNTELSENTTYLKALATLLEEITGKAFPSDSFSSTYSKYVFNEYSDNLPEFEVLKIDILNNKEEIKRLYSENDSFMMRQPVSLIIVHDIISNYIYSRNNVWNGDVDIYNEVCYYMGHSPRY